jgi:hypothetical protein
LCVFVHSIATAVSFWDTRDHSPTEKERRGAHHLATNKEAKKPHRIIHRTRSIV